MRCTECGLERGRLMDRRMIQDELGVSRAVAEGLMRQVRKVTFPGVRRVFVLRRDVEKLL